MSRLGSTKRARVDVAWRAAMGLQIGTPTPHEKTLRWRWWRGAEGLVPPLSSFEGHDPHPWGGGRERGRGRRPEGVEDADETTLDLALIPAEEGSDGLYRPTAGADTWDFVPADFSGAPAFETGPGTGALSYASIDMPLEDLFLDGTFAMDGDEIVGLHLDGLLDTREMGALVGDDGDEYALFDLAGAAGVPCVACADGTTTCLALQAEGDATWETDARW